MASLFIFLLFVLVVFLLFRFSSSFSSVSSANECQNPVISNPVIVKRNEGEIFLFGDETIQLKYESKDVDLFTIKTTPNTVSQRHVDKNYDQFFYILKGNYIIEYTDIKSGKKVNRNLKTGDIFYVKKGTGYSISDTSEDGGEVFGGYIPGLRFNLVKELAKYQKEVGRNNLNPEEIAKIEQKYCVFPD